MTCRRRIYEEQFQIEAALFMRDKGAKRKLHSKQVMLGSGGKGHSEPGKKGQLSSD